MIPDRFFFEYLYLQVAKKLLSAVRETRVSLHNGAPIEGPLLSPQYLSAVMFEKFHKDPQLIPHDTEKHQSLGQLYDSCGLVSDFGYILIFLGMEIMFLIYCEKKL